MGDRKHQLTSISQLGLALPAAPAHTDPAAPAPFARTPLSTVLETVLKLSTRSQHPRLWGSKGNPITFPQQRPDIFSFSSFKGGF